MDKQHREINQIIDPAILSELRKIELKSKRNVDSILMGKYKSAFRGSGLIFSDLREYQPGDDIKHIHWKVTARTNKPFIKTYDEDRQLSILLAVDISRSTDFGSPRTKHQRALEFAALLSILAYKSQDRVGLCLFSDTVEEYLPVKAGRGQVHRIIYSLLEHRHLNPQTSIKEACQHILKYQRKSSIVFVVSDFVSEPFEDEIRSLSHKHDLIGVFLENQLDHQLPRAGIVEFRDAENGELLLFDTSCKKSRNALIEAHRTRKDKIRKLFESSKADFITLGDDPLSPLARLMNRRTSRIR